MSLLQMNQSPVRIGWIGRLVLALALSLAVLPGCLGEDNSNQAATTNHDDDHSEDPAVEACEHYEEGPFVAVQAVSDATSPALAAVDNDHTAYQIALTEMTDSTDYHGFVAFESAEATEYIFFLSENVDVHFWQSDATTEINPEGIEAGAEGCGLVGVQYHIDLPVGTVLLEFMPDIIADVDLVIEEAGGEHNHKEEAGDDHDHH